jgi:SAM-dependent methyltransferase
VPLLTNREALRETVRRIAERRPGRSEATLAADIRGLLLSGYLDLDADDLTEVELEAAVGGGRRIDVEVGFTVIEVKRDLRAGDVRDRAIGQLAGYVRDRTEAFGQRYVGVLTDGAEWTLYQLRPDGELDPAATYLNQAATPDPERLCLWLEGALVSRHNVPPTPAEIERLLGAASTGHRLDYAALLALYRASRDEPSVRLKRGLWARLLTTAFGTGFTDDEDLFVNHTLLVVTSEVVAHAVLGFDVAALEPRVLLSGERFETAQIGGVVESDFFDWLLELEGGDRFVQALARRLAAFTWDDVEHDVMKVLYESILTPEQRHDLGEYYTPDWLASEMVERVVPEPLDVRVLDPACGSGTFLFQAVRRYIAAAEAAGRSNADVLAGVTASIFGLDLHPVAVTLARVTYLLAIGRERLRAERGPVQVPVYLGDSLQWARRESLLTAGTLTIETDDEAQLFASELRFPERLLRDAGEFDRLVAELARRATDRAPGSAPPSLEAIFRRFAVHPGDREMLEQTFRTLCELHDQRRDHIWGYYVRNLARPVWLAEDENRVDVLVGNPPWLAYRFMTPELRKTFRTMSQDRALWAGGGVATHQDLSGLFVVRSIELYLRSGGRFGFVMPRAALTRQQFAGFRGGRYLPSVNVNFDPPTWDLEEVEPSPFPVPSAVVFGERASPGGPLPADLEEWSGRLPRRNVSRSEAAELLERTPTTITLAGETLSPYHDRFKQGATILPRMLVVVEPAPAGPLGVAEGMRPIRSKRDAQEKRPWKDLPSLQGVVEERFLRPVLVGASLAPFRMLGAALGVVTWNGDELLHGDHDHLDDHPGIADYWRRAEAVWSEHRRSDAMELIDRQDYHRGLSGQFPIPPTRVVYSKAGIRLAAAVVRDDRAVIDHKLYWATAASIDEARYLIAILNTAELTERVRPYQASGEFGPRDFDKYVFHVPIPLFDPVDDAHIALVDLAERAETVAAGLDVEGLWFTRARQLVRSALDADGVGGDLEEAVQTLLDRAE